MLSSPSFLPQMPVIRSAAAKCPQHLLPVNESSVNSPVSSTADLIWGEAAALAPSTGPSLMSPLQLSPLLQVSQCSTKQALQKGSGSSNLSAIY